MLFWLSCLAKAVGDVHFGIELCCHSHIIATSSASPQNSDTLNSMICNVLYTCLHLHALVIELQLVTEGTCQAQMERG
jgi:hypothetical protein